MQQADDFFVDLLAGTEREPRCYIVGDAFLAGIFGRIRMAGWKGPVKRLLEKLAKRQYTTVIATTEFRSSQLSQTGKPAVHPRETRPCHRLPRVCRSDAHGVDELRCTCFCTHAECTARRKIRTRCEEHAHAENQHIVAYTTTQRGK
jgi:hypothetical protein